MHLNDFFIKEILYTHYKLTIFHRKYCILTSEGRLVLHFNSSDCLRTQAYIQDSVVGNGYPSISCTGVEQFSMKVTDSWKALFSFVQLIHILEFIFKIDILVLMSDCPCQYDLLHSDHQFIKLLVIFAVIEIGFFDTWLKVLHLKNKWRFFYYNRFSIILWILYCIALEQNNLIF